MRCCWVGRQLMDTEKPGELPSRFAALMPELLGQAVLFTWNLLFASGSSGCLSGWHCMGG